MSTDGERFKFWNTEWYRSSINEMMLISCDTMAEQSGNEKDACIGTVHRAKEKRLYQATIPT